VKVKLFVVSSQFRYILSVLIQFIGISSEMKKCFKWFFILSMVFILLAGGGIVGVYYHFEPDLPNVSTLKEVKLQTPMRVFSAGGELISQFGEKRRIPLKIDEIPDLFKKAFLATEDSRFYQHPGVDPIGITRAAVNLLVTGKKSQGASTITQQLARNFFLSNEKTYIRKIREIFIALHIEQLLSKDEILELYLNKISLGYRSFGVGSAAQVYYGKSVDELTLPEMAVIAGLPKAPSRLNPIRSPQRAKARRNIVLGRMLSMGYISQQEHDNAAAHPITAKFHGAEIELTAPYIAEMARLEIVKRFGDTVGTQGLNIYTTLTSKHQNAAAQALKNNLLAYDHRHGFRGAVASWLTEDGKLLANDELLEKLKALPGYETLLPAVVTKVEDKQVAIISKLHNNAVIEWDGMKWARQFKSDKYQGKVPKNASDILKIGDLIWVELLESEEKDKTKVSKDQPELVHYKLSQLPEAGGALVSLDPHDGAIMSLVGGFSYRQSKFNRVTQAKRQVGSNIKPFIYSAAIDNGLTLASIVNDAPINQWDESLGVAWRPKNSPPVYNGPIRVRQALAQSKNVVSVRLLRSVGITKVIQQLNKFGFDTSQLPHNDSLALGSASMTPIEVVTAFAVLANGGYKVEPYFIERVEDSYGQVLYQAEPYLTCLSCKKTTVKTLSIQELLAIPGDPLLQCFLPIQPNYKQAERVISSQTAFLISEAMKSAIWGGGNRDEGTYWNGTGWRAARELQRHDISGKTGTTNDSKDAWFSGFNPNLVATSWVGFDNFERTLGRTSNNTNIKGAQITGGEFGGKTALPAWNSYMKVALQDDKEKGRRVPAKIATVRIDKKTGLLSRAGGVSSRFEYFKQGTQPKEYAPSQEVIVDAYSEEELF